MYDININRSLMKLNLNDAIPEAQTSRTITKPIQNKTSKLRAARIADSGLLLKKAITDEPP